MAKRLAGRCGYPEAPREFDVTLHPERLEEPLRWKKPRMVFVCSMSDLFHEALALGHIEPIFDVIKATPQHTYQILTKRPERMAVALAAINLHMNNNTPFKNLWIGVTAENQEQAEKRIPVLLQIPAAVRFVSVEPMLGPVDLTSLQCEGLKWDALTGYQYQIENAGSQYNWQAGTAKLDWVICGGETGPGARTMDVLWARALCDQCADSGVPFFYKGAGTATYLKDDPYYRRLYGRLWEEFPECQEQTHGNR
jgi:protein gp37